MPLERMNSPSAVPTQLSTSVSILPPSSVSASITTPSPAPSLSPVSVTIHEHDVEPGNQSRPTLSSSYSKQFQKSLPPRFQRQQEQMKQQQWQQQQGVLSQPVQSQPSGSPVPPPQHRPLYQSVGPHPQHLASMGFDPRWLMMQPYMDPRIISGRPMDMTPMHPGIIPTKPLMRRDQIEGQTASSEPFEHMTQPIRDSGIPLSEPRVMWGTESYQHKDLHQVATSPKAPENAIDFRNENTVEQQVIPESYTVEHISFEPQTKSDFFSDSQELNLHTSQLQQPESVEFLQSEELSISVSCFQQSQNQYSVAEDTPNADTYPTLSRSISNDSIQNLKLEKRSVEAVTLNPKVPIRLSEPIQDDADDKAIKECFQSPKPTEVCKSEKPFKAKSETRWGPRPGSRGREDRPVRRSGPIKKPVLRDMKEEREQRKEKEEEHFYHDKPVKQEKTERKSLTSPNPLDEIPMPEQQQPIPETESQPNASQSSLLHLETLAENTVGSVSKPLVQPVLVTHSNKEDKNMQVVPKEQSFDTSKLETKPPVASIPSHATVPHRREHGLPPRSFRKEFRDRDWFPDQGYRGRSRGEYYSRGRSYRGSYGGRSRGVRGPSRDYPHYRDTKQQDLPGAIRHREESETRSESSDFEVMPKRRRQRGSETETDSEVHESASDTPLSDKEGVGRIMPHRDERSEEKNPPTNLPVLKSESVGSMSDIRIERSFSREDDSKTRPGFLPKGEPSRRGRGVSGFRHRGREPGVRPARPPPPRRPGYRDNQWITRQQESRHPPQSRMDEGVIREQEHLTLPSRDKRHLNKYERKFDITKERPKKQRLARPPRQDKPPRFRRLKERDRDDTGKPGETIVSNQGVPVLDVSHDLSSDLTGNKTPDLSNHNSSDQANEEWETASESSDFNERRERDENKVASSTTTQLLVHTKTLEGLTQSPPKRECTKRSFSSQRPGIDRQNRRVNAGPQKPGRHYSGPRGERRNGTSLQRGKKGPLDEHIPGISIVDHSVSVTNHYHSYHLYTEEASNALAPQKGGRESAGKKKEEPRPITKKSKEKVDALSQFDLNNYASVVIIDDHPEVTTLEDSQSNINDGFTEVVSKKQQKRLQDEERRKKEEQTVQIWTKKGSTEKGRNQNSKLPPRFVKKQQQQAAALQIQSPVIASPYVPVQTVQASQATAPVQPQTASTNNSEFSGQTKAPPASQLHNTLGTELWENKIVLNDLSKKMGQKNLPQPPPSSAWSKPLTGCVPPTTPEASSQETSIDLAIESIQFGAPVSSSSDNEGGSTLSDKVTDSLPEPKEQRQKQPRVGTIKSHKITDISLIQNKGYKPGPIGKERSLKNRKVKEVQQQVEPETQENSIPATGLMPEPVPQKESTVVTEVTTEISSILSVSAPEFGTSSKDSVIDYTSPSSSIPNVPTPSSSKIDSTLVSSVPLSHTLPLPRRETLQQNSSLTPVSPATVDLTLKMESARKAWENSPSIGEKGSPITSVAPPSTSTVAVGPSTSSNSGVVGVSASSSSAVSPTQNSIPYNSFSSTSIAPIPVASVTPTTNLAGAVTFTTSSHSTKTSTSDPPNICKVKPQQLQSSSNLSSSNHFSQLSCIQSLIAQQQSTQVYVSQSAAGPAAQIPAFYMDTSHLFSSPHARLAPPTLTQQQGFQPGLSQIPIPIYAPLQGQHQAQLGLAPGPSVSQAQELFTTSLQPYRSQQAFLQNNLSQPSPVVLSGATLHNFPGVQHQDLTKAQSSMAYQQTSSAQPIPFLYEHQIGQSGLGGSQLIDTHILQTRQGLGQQNLYSGQVQQTNQANFYNTAQSPTALQQMTVSMQGSQLSLPSFGSTTGQPLIALPQTLQPAPQTQHQNLSRAGQVSQGYRSLIPTGSQHGIMATTAKVTDIDLKPYGGGLDYVKPGTPPGRSTTPTSSPFRTRSTSPNSQISKINSLAYQKHQYSSTASSIRLGQAPFPTQFPPQIISQPSLVPSLVRTPHPNTFQPPVQRQPMALPSQTQPQMPTSLMSHPRLHHMSRAHPVPPSSVRVTPAHAAMKAEQELKAKQRAEVLQSTHRFFEQQHQQSKPFHPKLPNNTAVSTKTSDTLSDAPMIAQDKVENTKPASPLAPVIVPASAKPIRTGPIKPQAIKTEETKS
ncbi:protein PRRC2C [Bombina bombina]|uniref:protein PRRC2C n=1 Tax=Bombina bombina TaxID=8345 RepID=UPI00235AAD13|nr:protein PRRC2C [Bombina bombina]